MLFSEDDCNLLFFWVFFICCLVNVDGLFFIVFCELFVSNDLLKDVWKEIGVVIKEYFWVLVQNNWFVFNKILDVYYFYIKVIVLEDNELFCLFMDYFLFEMNKGIRSFGSICLLNNIIYYICNLEDFR